MGGDASFVEFVAEAGGGGWDDAAVLPDDRLGEDVAVELGEGLDPLLDQEVGRSTSTWIAAAAANGPPHTCGAMCA